MALLIVITQLAYLFTYLNYWAAVSARVPRYFSRYVYRSAKSRVLPNTISNCHEHTMPKI